MDSKKWYLSKTLWLQIFAIVALVVPQSSSFISEHLSEAGGVFVAANFLLRLITKDKLEIK